MSPARTCPSLASAAACTPTPVAACGRISRSPSLPCSPHSSSWRTSVDSCQPKRIATWNPTRGIWETDSYDLLSEHSEPFSETWPTSGTTRNGTAYELPTPELRTAGSASSSLPTPRAMDSVGGIYPLDRPDNMDNLETRIVRLLKTPTSQLAVNGGSQHPDRRKAGGHGPTLADEVEHLIGAPMDPLSDDGNESPAA